MALNNGFYEWKKGIEMIKGYLDRCFKNRILRFIRKLKCDHQFITTSNFHGDYINHISSGFPVYRSRQKCIKCGKERLSEWLDESCAVINDGLYVYGG